MKATELRIGNYISDIHADKGCWEVRTLMPEKCIYHTYSARYKDLRPIPLTEYWLIKFGFEKLDKYTFVKSGFFIHKRKVGFVFNVGRKKIVQNYVHTIQNTYFCIEQKELL